MSTAISTPKSATGKLFFISGLVAGREIFLGKAIDEPDPDHLILEGKVLTMRPRGRMVVRPFLTTTRVSLREPNISVQEISDPRAHEEARGLLTLTATHASRASYPFIVRWVELTLRPTAEASLSLEEGEPERNPVGADPFFSLYQGFLATAEEFRRILFRARQIETTRELDQVTELEGDLLIEIGKIANQAALKLNRILSDERELGEFLLAFQGPDLPLGHSRASMSGWPYLFGRLSAARGWARRNGKAELVRDINALLKDAIFALNEVLLDHGNSLDTLVTETFGQYGLAIELPGEGAGVELPAPPTAVLGGIIQPVGVGG